MYDKHIEKQRTHEHNSTMRGVAKVRQLYTYMRHKEAILEFKLRATRSA